MTLSAAYLEVAERALLAANAALSAAIQEKAAFLGYHAFESCGGAFCASRGVPYPIGHTKKLNTFKNAARSEREARAIARLAIDLASIRNLCLYPEPRQDGTIRRPNTVITPAQATRLLARVNAMRARIALLV